jgi:hypothetical protein
MKYCPNCQTTYTDDTLRFCLQDGTQLADVPDTSTDMPTVAFNEPETIVTPKTPQQVVRINLPDTQQQNQERVERPQIIEQPRVVEQPRIVQQPVETRKSNTALTVLATILGMIVIFGIGGAWFLLNSRKSEVAAVNTNTNTAAPNRQINSNPANSQIQNANIAKPTVAPTATPSPKPSLEAGAAKAITNDVKDAVDDWVNSSESLDLDGNLDYYADSVDYYIAGRVNRSRVRADKQRAFDQYDSINFDISNLKITPDTSGEKAVAIFDKEWKFEGAGKNSTGKVQQQLTLSKIDGRWLITGEKDLKTYYVGK